MKAIQVNFYLDRKDLEKLENQVLELGFQVGVLNRQTAVMTWVQTLQKQEGTPSTRFLVLQGDENKLQITKTQNNTFRVQEETSPIVEYMLTDCEDGYLRYGRLFYYSQNEEFNNQVVALFDWFKKTFEQYDDAPFFGFYASETVAKIYQIGVTA